MLIPDGYLLQSMLISSEGLEAGKSAPVGDWRNIIVFLSGIRFSTVDI